MNCNAEGLAIIKEFEGCKLISYQDGNGIWTIGWGHTGPDIMDGVTCTQEQADAWLEDDVGVATSIIADAITADLNENQFSACVSLCFNIGPGHKDVRDGFVTQRSGAPSTILTHINSGNLGSVPADFLQWDHVAGKTSAGLLRRRLREKMLWQTPLSDT